MKRILSIGLAALILVGLAGLILALPAAAAGLAQTAPPFDANIILELFLSFGQMAGIAALIAAVTQVLKWFGLIPDNYAGAVFAGLNLLFMLAVVIFHFALPDVALDWVNQQAGIYAQILLLILGYVMQLKIGSGTANTMAAMRIPILGASHTKKELLAYYR